VLCRGSIPESFQPRSFVGVENQIPGSSVHDRMGSVPTDVTATKKDNVRLPVEGEYPLFAKRFWQCPMYVVIKSPAETIGGSLKKAAWLFRIASNGSDISFNNSPQYSNGRTLQWSAKFMTGIMQWPLEACCAH